MIKVSTPVLCSDISFHVTLFCEAPASPVMHTDESQCFLHKIIFFLSGRGYFVLYYLVIKNELQ